MTDSTHDKRTIDRAVNVLDDHDYASLGCEVRRLQADHDRLREAVDGDTHAVVCEMCDNEARYVLTDDALDFCADCAVSLLGDSARQIARERDRLRSALAKVGRWMVGQQRLGGGDFTGWENVLADIERALTGAADGSPCEMQPPARQRCEAADPGDNYDRAPKRCVLKAGHPGEHMMGDWTP